PPNRLDAPFGLHGPLFASEPRRGPGVAPAREPQRGKRRPQFRPLTAAGVVASDPPSDQAGYALGRRVGLPDGDERAAGRITAEPAGLSDVGHQHLGRRIRRFLRTSGGARLDPRGDLQPLAGLSLEGRKEPSLTVGRCEIGAVRPISIDLRPFYVV